MIRSVTAAILLFVPTVASAQRLHDARVAMVRPASSAMHADRLSTSADSMSRKTKIGLSALGGAILVGGIVALRVSDDPPECEDICFIPPVAYATFLTSLGAIAGGLLGALIGAIITSGG